MKTINELGIYFMCCFIFATLFITYLAVKLRAYRIKNARLTNQIEIAYKDINDAYDEVNKLILDKIRSDEMDRFYKELLQKNVEEFESFSTESAAIINQSAENNAKLVLEIESLKANEDALKLFYETQIESLKSDRQKLFEIAKGATTKLAEMNVALEGLEVKEEPKNMLRVGDYVKGLILGFNQEMYGQIEEFSLSNNPKVNGLFLELSTCKPI